jgi:hypothetical protein
MATITRAIMPFNECNLFFMGLRSFLMKDEVLIKPNWLMIHDDRLSPRWSGVAGSANLISSRFDPAPSHEIWVGCWVLGCQQNHFPSTAADLYLNYQIREQPKDPGLGRLQAAQPLDSYENSNCTGILVFFTLGELI